MAKIKVKVDDLYQQGMIFKLRDESQNAAKLLWQALACGSKEASFGLYQIFHEGINIVANEKAAVTFVHVGKLLDDPQCIELCNKSSFKEEVNSKVQDELSFLSRNALRTYKGEVTEGIIKERVTLCDGVIELAFGNYYTMHELANAMPVSTVGEGSNGNCIIF